MFLLENAAFKRRDKKMSTNELREVKGDIADIFVDMAEDKLNTFIKIRALIPIPKIKIVATLAKGIVGIRSAYQLKMIEQFINTVNSGVATPGELKIHLERLKSNKKQLTKEVNYILVKLNSWTDLEKSMYFGNLYIAYISQIISWNELMLYTDILCQIMLYDIENLKEIYEKRKYKKEDYPPFGSMLRLQSLGLVVFHDGYVRQTSKNAISGEIKEERGHISGDGRVFYKLITEHKIM